jgi:hypothetical protein
MTSVFAIAEEHGRGIIRGLPVKDQIEVLERIVRFPPDRDTQKWATKAYLDLTNPKMKEPDL